MEFVLFLVFGVILALLFALFLLKDSQTEKKFARYEKAIESIMQENFALKKQISSLMSVKDGEIVDFGALESSLDEKIQKTLNDKVIPLFNSLKSIENAIDSFQSEQENRIYNLEERARDFSKVSAPNIENEEEQIVKLYEEGKNIETIAKDLRLGVGRVELTLKMQGLI